MKPIETVYGGVRFRSRVEARWAVFFTRLGLEWEYEEQGWKSGNNARPYLPDFLLPDLGLYIEIKPTNAYLVDPEGVARWQEFATEIAENFGHERSIPLKHPGVKAEAAMICGPPPDPEMVRPWGPQPPPSWPYERGVSVLGEAEWTWCVCPSGQHFDIQLFGRGNRITCGCSKYDDVDARAEALADGIDYAISTSRDEMFRGISLTGDDIRILNAYGAARVARFEHGQSPTSWS